MDIFGDTGEVAYLLLEALRLAMVGFAAAWQLASRRCLCSLMLSIWLLVTACPCFSLIPASNELKERSISNSSGDVEWDEVADVVVSGLQACKDSCKLLSDEVSDEDVVLSVPLELVISVHEQPEGELGKDTEDSLVVVSDTGCELAG